jgi:hypothetical protein
MKAEIQAKSTWVSDQSALNYLPIKNRVTSFVEDLWRYGIMKFWANPSTGSRDTAEKLLFLQV